MTKLKLSRLTVRQAAERLAVHRQTVRTWIRCEEFTAVRDGEPRPGRPVYLLSDEVEACVEGGLPALREFRARMRR